MRICFAKFEFESDFSLSRSASHLQSIYKNNKIPITLYLAYILFVAEQSKMK